MIGWALIACSVYAGWLGVIWRNAAVGILGAALLDGVIEGAIVARYQAELFGGESPYMKFVVLRFIGGLVMLSAAYWLGRWGGRTWRASR